MSGFHIIHTVIPSGSTLNIVIGTDWKHKLQFFWHSLELSILLSSAGWIKYCMKPYVVFLNCLFQADWHHCP